MTEPIGVARPSLPERLGPRAARRAEPRASIAVAGAGCVLAVIGVLIVSGDTGVGDSGELNRWPGVILSAAVVALGWFVLANVRTGAVATGGAVAAALGVPPLMFFLTFDQEGLPPYSTEAILGVSTAAWLGAHLWGPGRGRPFFLGAGLLGLWALVLEVTEGVFDAPWGLLGGGWVAYSPTTEDGMLIEEGMGDASAMTAPDLMTMGMLTLVLGVAYLVIARVLDGSGHHGTATPFAAATLPLLVTAPLLLADDLDTAGTGLLLAAIGAALALNAAASLRRLTTWAGGALVALGVAVFLTEMTDDATVGGMLFLAAGIALVFAGHAYAAARNEPDEMAVTAVAVPVATLGPDTPPPAAPTPAPDDTLWAPPPPDDEHPPPPAP